MTTRVHASDVVSVRRVIDDTTALLRDRASAVLVRSPALDSRLPETSDLDVLAFTDIDDLRPERLHREDESGGPGRTVDVMWLPLRWLDRPETLASHGLIAHRVASSEVTFCVSAHLGTQMTAAARHLYRPDIHQKRLAGFFEMGSLTVREIGLTWDCPAVGLFWLHMAHAACLAAALDGTRRLCPNVYTRPFDYVGDLDGVVSIDIRDEWICALQLDAEPAEAAAAVTRIHQTVTRRFPEPDWPSTMRQSTRFEYRYWLRPEELRWRLSVVGEMCRRGYFADAVYYLRFHAYALARAPMVHARATEGRDVSYLRPEKAVRPDLERLCPEILDDLNLALAGTRTPARGTVEDGLARLLNFRDRVMDLLHRSGAPVPDPGPWIPHPLIA